VLSKNGSIICLDVKPDSHNINTGAFSNLHFLTGACSHMGIHLPKAKLIAFQSCISLILIMSKNEIYSNLHNRNNQLFITKLLVQLDSIKRNFNMRIMENIHLSKVPILMGITCGHAAEI
jgi:hypothetical protein